MYEARIYSAKKRLGHEAVVRSKGTFKYFTIGTPGKARPQFVLSSICRTT